MTWSRKSQRLFLTATGMVQTSDWQPAADLYEAPYGWLVKLELAGRHVKMAQGSHKAVKTA